MVVTDAVLGIDIGTTGTKTLVLDNKCNIISSGYYEYELITSSGGVVEQNADDWIDGIINSVNEALSKIEDYKIHAISLSTQGASMAIIDAKNKPVSNVITWMDSRCTVESDILNNQFGLDVLYRKTGYRTNVSSDSAKILWLQKHQPELINKTYKYISTIEYVNYFLTSKYVIDPSNAGIRGLFNINTMNWDNDIINFVNIDNDSLPDILRTGEYIGNLSFEAAKILNLDTDVKIYNGAHDQYCAALGCGALDDGDMLLSTGTTWVVLGITDNLTFNDAYTSLAIHPVDGMYGALASLKNGGSALKWLKTNFFSESYEEIDSIAQNRIFNTSNLYFAPFFNGAGFPHSRSNLLSGIYGLQLHHDKYDLALALMEGTSFEIKSVLNKYAEVGINISRLKMSGGAAKSNIWSLLTGYITGCEISVMKETEACALGAGLIAGVGCGMYDNYRQDLDSKIVVCNDNEIMNHYEEKYVRYKKYIESLGEMI